MSSACAVLACVALVAAARRRMRVAMQARPALARAEKKQRLV